MIVPLLKISNLSVEFGKRGRTVRVIRDVNFEMGQGEAVGLVGESGSGKSVTSLATMRLLPRHLARIATGRIEFDGRNLLEIPDGEMCGIRGRDIAMIFQEPMSSLNPVMVRLDSSQNLSRKWLASSGISPTRSWSVGMVMVTTLMR